MDGFYAYTRHHEELGLDELVMTLGVVSSVYVSVFALRRWAEAARRLKQANTDKLTGLSNRHRSRVILAHEMTRATRYRRLLTIILFDVESFKNINDTYGHPAGDQILKADVRVARETVRMVDYPIRWGGEEFIVLLPDRGLEEALHLAERLHEAIVRVAIRVAGADQAMYIARYLGRNRLARSK